MADENEEMRNKMELNLHNSFSENYNSLTGTVITILMTSVAVLYGYGYVFLECSNNLASCLFQIKDYNDQLIEIMVDQKPLSIVGIQGKTDLNINALVLTFLAVEFVLFALMHILVVQGTSLRREQFIVYMFRQKNKLNIKPEANITGSYSPFGKKCLNILPGLYKELFIILACIASCLLLTTICRVCCASGNSDIRHCFIAYSIIVPYLVFCIILCGYSLCKNFNKYYQTQKEYISVRKLKNEQI